MAKSIVAYHRQRKAARKLTKKDKSVISAFLGQNSADSGKLMTDGKSLDGNWTGGKGIAVWEAGKVQFQDLGSKSVELIQNAVKRMAPKMVIAAEVAKSNPKAQAIAQKAEEVGTSL